MSRDWIDDIKDMRALLQEVYNTDGAPSDDLRQRIGVMIGLKKKY